MLVRFLQVTRKFKYLLLLFSLFLTVFMASQALRMSIKTDLLELLPSHFKTVKSLKKIADLTGGIGYFICVFESEEREQNIKALEEFSLAAKEDPGILYVDYINPATFIQKNGMLWLPLANLKLLRNDLKARIDYHRRKALSLLPEEMGPPPPFQTEDLLMALEEKVNQSPYHEVKDGKMMVSILKPTVDSTNVDFTKALYVRMSELSKKVNIKYPGVKTAFTGIYPDKVGQIKSLESDFLLASIFTLLGITFSLLYFFRSIKAIIVVSFPLIIGLIWTLGVNYFLVGHVNLISIFFVSVLMGLGIDYSLQIYSRFKEEYLKHPDYHTALYTSFITTGKGTLFGALTTFGVFFVLVFSDFLTFRETGILSALGVVLILTSILIHLPVFVYIVKPSFSYFTKNNKVEMEEDSFSLRLMDYVNTHRKKILRWVGFAAIVSLFFVPFIRFEYDFINLENNNTESRKKWYELNSEMDHSIRPSVFLVNSIDDLSKLRNYLNEFSNTKYKYIKDHMSILNYYPYPSADLDFRVRTVHQIRSMLLKNLGNLNQKDQKNVNKYKKYLYPRPTALEDYPRQIRNAFVGKEGDEYRFFYLVFPPSDLRMGLRAFEYARELKDVQKKSGVESELADNAIILEEILALIFSEGRVILPVALCVVILLIYILFRSVKKVMIVLFPLMLGLLFLGALLGLTNLLLPTGISLNYYNVVVIPILIGVGIDYSIHIFHRLEEAYSMSNKPLKRKWRDVIQTAYALMISAITTTIGFSSLFLAHYSALQSIAWISVLGILIILLVSSIAMPALFFHMRSKDVHS